MRHCSVCHNPGHTKRSCAKRSDESAMTRPVGSARSRKDHPAKPRVLVRVTSGFQSSPHIVNLRLADKRGEQLEQMPVFVERPKKSEPMRRTVNLSDLVRAAKQREIESWQPRVRALAEHLARRHEGMFRKPLLSADSPFFQSTFSLNWRKLAYAAVSLFLLIGLPLPGLSYYQKLKDINGRVVRESTNGFLALQASTAAAFQSNIAQAEQDLTQALQSFAAAQSFIERDYQLLLALAELVPVLGQQISSRQQLLLAGHHLALGNTYLVKGVDEAQRLRSAPLTERFALVRAHLQSAIPQYREALQNLQQLNHQAVPAQYQTAFVEFKVLFAALVDDMRDLVDLADVVSLIFGDDSFKRYLVIFQNHHELRPTGGFMGSFAVVDVQKGKILNIEVPGGGTYDLQGQLTEYVRPPVPLQLVNKRWEFQDANWWPDFAASAQKIAWFYERARGATVDGVIAVNASVLERLLKVVGPVKNEPYQLVLNHETVLESLQNQVELASAKETGQPKQVLAALLEQFMSLLTNLESVDVVRLLAEAQAAAEGKEVQLFVSDEATQQRLRQFGWTGEVLPVSAPQDYLLVAQANLQGQKSDARIGQTIEHQAVVAGDGSVVDTVVVRRTHTGLPGEQFYGATNISYLRLYVPEGAELLDAGGFTYPPEEAFKVPESWYKDDAQWRVVEGAESIHVGTGTRVARESGKTAFGNWVVTRPGETSEVFFQYRLPFRVAVGHAKLTNPDRWRKVLAPESGRQTSRYSLVVQKQSGINSQLVSTIIYPVDWVPAWKSNTEIDLALNGARYEGVLAKDLVIGLVMERAVSH